MSDETTVSLEEQAQESSGDTDGQAGEADIDISKIPAEKLLSHPEVQKQLQSLKDKEAARVERQFNERLTREAAARERMAQERELDSLVQSEDFDSLGRRTADERARTKNLTEAAKEVTAVMEDLIRQRPEFKDLGEEAFTNIYNSVKDRQGTIIDLMADLSIEKYSQDLTKQVKAAMDKMGEEVDARFASYGLEKRTEDAEKGNAPSAAISKGKGASAPTGSDDELLEAYGRGEDIPQDKIRTILAERGIKV